ncbi:hypothetical protein B0H67DRAFT_635304 [Lasiosphaeris hirsuta]|uniref:Uncharacterized protein n=1 Tax=Lasiosphaeris hirsuta TaxID=260670 RepID=A0AA40A7Q0_9PEZI|nr:hypothetical protein B0H67DRAFT_635304 [Lasiosphaeris hirsuta]
MASSSLVYPMPPLPNKRTQGTIGADLIVTYHSDLAHVRLDGWETDDTQSVQVSLALPRDGGLTPIIPRVLSGNDESVPWPTSSAHASFAGPVDLDTFHIKGDFWPEVLTKTSVFIKLGSYLLPESDRPPRKGVHVCHVLLLFPLEGSWIVCSGRILGVLNRELIQGPALSGHNAPIPSNPVPESPTQPRPAGPGGIASRNPFSSPSRGQKGAPPTKHSHRKVTESPVSSGGEQTSRDLTTTGVELMTVPSSGSDVTEHGSDIEQLLDDQLTSTSATPTRKRKGPGSPGSGRSKRTTAGKRRAQLCD